MSRRAGQTGSAGRSRATPALIAVVAVGGAAVAAGAFYAGYAYGRSTTRHARDQARDEADAGPRTPRHAAAGGDAGSPGGPAATAAPAAAVQATMQHMDARPVAATSGNFLLNSGFEEGPAGWKWLDWSQEWGSFEVTDGVSASGSKSAHLALRGLAGDRRTRVHGVVQEIAPQVFPQRISGRYRVDRWEPGDARKVYLQAVVIAAHSEGTLPSMQVRYVLEGVTEPPYNMSNARYRFFHTRTQPPLGEWIDFSLPVREDFLELWGKVPPPGTPLRVLFEARWDDKPPGGALTADVYYDDLFVGVP